MKFGDKVLMLFLGCMALLFLGGMLSRKSFLFLSPSSVPLQAVIRQGGTLLRKVNLEEVENPYTLRVETDHGHYNLLRVEPGRIRFAEADCPHKLCISSGWLSRPGEMALCLPHRILVYIDGDLREETSVDAVAH